MGDHIKSGYAIQLQEQIDNLQEKLEQRVKQRNDSGTSSPQFYELQSEINSIRMDIKTKKSRIENIGKEEYLPTIYTIPRI